MRAIVALEKPVIAAVEASPPPPAASSSPLATSRSPAADARFACPACRSVSLFDAAGRRRPRRLRKHAMEMALTGDLYDAETPSVSASSTASSRSARRSPKRTRSLSASPPVRRRRWRSASARYYRQIDMPLDEAYALAGRAMIDQSPPSRFREGAAAFLDKRPPRWEGA